MADLVVLKSQKTYDLLVYSLRPYLAPRFLRTLKPRVCPFHLLD